MVLQLLLLFCCVYLDGEVYWFRFGRRSICLKTTMANFIMLIQNVPCFYLRINAVIVVNSFFRKHLTYTDYLIMLLNLLLLT